MTEEGDKCVAAASKENKGLYLRAPVGQGVFLSTFLMDLKERLPPKILRFTFFKLSSVKNTYHVYVAFR